MGNWACMHACVCTVWWYSVCVVDRESGEARQELSSFIIMEWLIAPGVIIILITSMNIIHYALTNRFLQ